MNPWWGWGLALLALVLGQALYGWQGLLFALSVVVFWLLLSFSRLMRVMRQAGAAPVGQVASVVMLQSRLQRGMRLIDVLRLTGSLGERQRAPHGVDEERWCWRDPGGAEITLVMRRGRLREWNWRRPGEEAG